MDDSQDELLLEAYQSYANETDQQPPAKRILLNANENYVDQSEPEPTEEEFLLKAYHDYDSATVEWPNFRNEETYEKFRGNEEEPLPLLIRECARLIPVVSEEEGAYVDFYPFNMPQDQIKNINVIGMIVGRQVNKLYLEIKVYDGTGTLTVLYKMEKFENDRQRRQDIDRNHGVLETDVERFTHLMKLTVNPNQSSEEQVDPAVEEIQRFQEEHSMWWEECDHGMLGSPLEIGSYVDAYGYCNLKSDESRRDPQSNNFWDTGYLPVLIFNAYTITSISESDYNVKIQGWLKGVFPLKYLPNTNSEHDQQIAETEIVENPG